MLVPYESLKALPQSTVDNLIKEYLFSQMEDGSFDATNSQSLETAIAQCHRALQAGELQVEYSEDDESIAIRQRNDLNISPQ
ncbi:YheU family protein [Shewanella gelidii]|uniref:YheU family protein n=1 Tax=Shewanella gelidii TaxID=1642821 RepID=A0A917JP76_9GAMM|nr:YheU family protein [Shewanella gelidii]MCL1097768.1 YheU family protein [Shewanella gelidii]GGI78968.1 hypothetical protein GCM10009332_15400 [Shewanella gelidii]